MLNLTQRLILGCILLGCLTVALVIAVHKALSASGQLGLGYAFVAVAILIAAATIFFVLRPIQKLQATHTASPREIWNIAWTGAAATALVSLRAS